MGVNPIQAVPARQYKGMRYVPIFDGEWDNTKNYDPLVVVSHLGNSYTSKTFIPAGIDISNETYWALTGNYNAQVEAYRQEVANLAEIVDNKLPYRTLADVLHDETLSDGDLVVTSGYHSVGIGGATYEIVSSEPSTYYEELDNGLYAKLVIEDTMSFEQFGAYGDNIHDDSSAVQAAFYNCGKISATRTYLIQNDVELNKTGDITPEVGLKNTLVIGRGKNTSLAESSATVADVSMLESTFVFDNASFCLRGTSKVDFEYCVFTGITSSEKNETIFKLTDPARKLNLNYCTFSNFKYGVYCDDNTRWSGESVYTNLYFMVGEYGIYYEKGGYDCIVENCIAQGSVDYFLFLKNSLGALISSNHDYSKYGTHAYFGANIVNNYFDGIGKLHIKCSLDSSGSGTGKYSSHGTNICGNIFLTNLHNTVISVDSACIIVENDTFHSTNVVNNVIHGGLDNAKLALVDITNVTTCGNNHIENNSGYGLDCIFLGNATSKNNYYYNKYEGFMPKVNVASGAADNVKTQVIPCENGFIAKVRLNTTHIMSDCITLDNYPVGGTIDSFTIFVDNNDDMSIVYNSSPINSSRDGKSQLTIYFVNYGQTSITDVDFDA